MCICELLDRIERHNKKRQIMAAQHFAVGAGAAVMVFTAAAICFNTKMGRKMWNKMTVLAANTAEEIENTVSEKVETAKKTAEHVVKDASAAVEAVREKAEDVKEDLHNGRDVTHDFHNV
jgi:hypothetical protein